MSVVNIQDDILAKRGLPPIVFIANPNKVYGDSRMIAIKRGHEDYFAIDDPTANADDLNKLVGVTPQQREAMLCGFLFGWNVPGANPNSPLHKDAK